MRRCAAVLGATVLTLGACTASVREEEVVLDGRSFTAVEVHGHELVAGTRVQVSFTDGLVEAHAGCNHLGGEIEIADGYLRMLEPGPWNTDMACDPELHEQDEWLLGLLASEPAVRTDGDRLTIEDGAERLVLVEE